MNQESCEITIIRIIIHTIQEWPFDQFTKRTLKESQRTKTITPSDHGRYIKKPNYLKKTEQHGEPQHNEPNNVHQKQSLPRNRRRATIPDFTEPQFRNLHACARRLCATAPVRHAVRAANGVGAEALCRARRRRRFAAQAVRRQPQHAGVLEIRRRRDGEDHAERGDGDRDDEES